MNKQIDPASGLCLPSSGIRLPELSFAIPCGDADFLGLPEASRKEAKQMLVIVQAIAISGNVNGACKFYAERFAGVRGMSWQRLRARFYEYRKTGNWRVLIDRARGRLRAQREDLRLPLPFVEFWKGLCEENKRGGGDAAAHRALLIIWRTHRHPVTQKYISELPGYTAWPPAIDRTGLPPGWTYANLTRHSPSTFEKTVARIGRSAAAAHRPLVYRTRADLWTGSHYMFDDLWHDHFVNCLDLKKSGRPLEFGAFDLYSACKFAWGMRVRTENDATGKMEGLKEEMMRYLLASVLAQHGYSPRGTVLIVEHGTAAIREDLERLLYDLSDRKITVSRSGMDGGGDALGIYGGRGKGNFRFKSAYESLHNLVHNEMGLLPGQTGRNKETRPEATHGLLKQNDTLLAAFAWLEQENPDLAGLLRFPLMEFGQFLQLALAIYGRINSRTEHDLEGWAKQISAVQRGDRWYFRRLSPWEVWSRGRSGLTKLEPSGVALILGPDIGVTREIRGAVLELQDKTVSNDPMKFDTHGLDAGEYQTVLNPFSPDRLYVFNTAGGYVRDCPRIWRISYADVEAMRRRCGEVKHIEARMLAAPRARGAKLIQERIADARHNMDVIKQATAGSRAPMAIRKIEADDFERLEIAEAADREESSREDQEQLLENI